MSMTAVEAKTQASAEMPVCSHNEWDPLEEIIVGRVTGASVPPWHVSLQSAAPFHAWDVLKALSGKPAPPQFVLAAQQDLDQFIHILESEGVKVRRPDPLPQTVPYSTPDWSIECGYNIANPRDLLIVIGDEILETPSAWRCRYFEVHAYRTLLHEYFRAGATWTSAPKPRLADELYNEDWQLGEKGDPIDYSLNESECTFDAADFIRCGRDIFCTRSNVTNEFGIEWLRRHLGGEYSIHVIETQSRQPMHIDTTFVPLCPGKALINPTYIDRDKLPPILNSWELRESPPPVINPAQMLDLSSAWLTMNVLMLDPDRVVVKANQEPLIKMLKDWGFDPVPCPFENHFVYGGAFHCATLDVRRRGSLESYF
ncbi:MAG: hypothetical protein VB875_14220 [Pirellulales bacterium]